MFHNQVVPPVVEAAKEVVEQMAEAIAPQGLKRVLEGVSILKSDWENTDAIDCYVDLMLRFHSEKKEWESQLHVADGELIGRLANATDEAYINAIKYARAMVARARVKVDELKVEMEEWYDGLDEQLKSVIWERWEEMIEDAAKIDMWMAAHVLMRLYREQSGRRDG